MYEYQNNSDESEIVINKSPYYEFILRKIYPIYLRSDQVFYYIYAIMMKLIKSSDGSDLSDDDIVEVLFYLLNADYIIYEPIERLYSDIIYDDYNPLKHIKDELNKMGYSDDWLKLAIPHVIMPSKIIIKTVGDYTIFNFKINSIMGDYVYDMYITFDGNSDNIENASDWIMTHTPMPEIENKYYIEDSSSDLYVVLYNDVMKTLGIYTSSTSATSLLDTFKKSE